MTEFSFLGGVFL